ncbi:hypothetical protein ACCQ23_10135 [Xanthomonas axonopodis pv. phyllanthi]|uniref:hypothetical protein n=1 Tax=Xanthomonas axonopodis TaxID=53413 RepID=UPI003557C217
MIGSKPVRPRRPDSNQTASDKTGAVHIVASQVADDLNDLAEIHGFATLILDWQPDAPRLAAVLMQARAEVDEFLSRNVPTAGLAAKATEELQALSGQEDLAGIAHSVLGQLRVASVGTPMAQNANRRWLVETLSNRIRAKSRLGQVLTPLDAGGASTLTRSHLIDELQIALERPSEARLVSVIGDEGNGKSWLAITACIELPTAPLVIVFSPEEFLTIREGVDWDVILAQKLVAQTDGSDVGISEKRWRRRLKSWRKRQVTLAPRLLVLVDGLNQRPAVTWGRHTDSLVLHTHELGGCTIVTSRSEYFKRHVEPRLISPVTSVIVPPWTARERDQILASKGITGANLQPAVANSLLNPRLLGIALTLLDADTLESLESLSVPWLLFEHLRMLDRERSDGHSAIEFAALLQGHAKDILTRVRSEVADDLTVFDNLEPAAEGRFFQWVDGEPNRYTLREQGLTYALGLAVIEELRAAVRNGRDVQEALQAVLEPISALDQTADATIAALTIACLDQRISEHIGVALLVGFAQLQNPDGVLAALLTGLASRRVRVFFEACEVLWMESSPAPNADWVEASLQTIKYRPDVRRDMQTFLDKWLRYWWPNIRVDDKVSNAQDSSVEVRREAEAERDQRINSLNDVELDYLSKLIRQQASPYRLMQLALQLCADMPLETFADSLSCASFSMALTPTPLSPHEELSSLILFNHRDWHTTRDRLITHATRLASPGTSTSGRWAAVNLLRATGAINDSALAHKLVLDLTKNRERFTSWRRVEQYCATDPCDPDSDRPDNIDETANKYAQLEVCKLRLFMGMNADDHFVDSALPGLARFSQDVAVQKRREFLTSITSRRGLPLRQATWVALDDAALIDSQLAARLQTLSISLTRESSGIDEASFSHVQQALLVAVFPRLSPHAQFSSVDALPDPNRIWLELLRLAKGGVSSELIGVARQRDPSDLRVAVPLIVAGCMADGPLPGVTGMLPGFLASEHSLVRTAALHLARRIGDPESLRAVVSSGWKAETAPLSTRERITGSLTLIEAARVGIVAAQEIYPRIAPETFGIACAQLDDASIEQLAVMLDACVRAASGFDVPLPAVKVFLSITRTEDEINARYSLDEVSTAPKSFDDLLMLRLEGESEFYERERRLHNAFEAFKTRLTPQMAAIVLDAFRLKEIQAILRVAPNVVQGWINLFSNAAASRRRALRNFGLYVACALTHNETSSEGIELLTLLQGDSSFVQVQHTLAGLPLEAVALWWSADVAEVNRLRFARLDACGNDQELAVEAATAIYADKTQILKTYVRDRLNSPLPVDIARAITVAGFTEDANFASEVIAKFDGDEGLLVTAARSNRYAMDRYEWSKHWFDKMLAANTEEEFWRASVLFLKVVDARFDAEHRDQPVGTETFNTWWWSVERRLKRRFNRWAEKRKKTLFGSKVPDPVYLQQARHH